MSFTSTQFQATRPETRAEVTDRIAREIIDAENAAREQQVERLRTARLRKEAAERSAPRPAPAPKRRVAAR